MTRKQISARLVAHLVGQGAPRVAALVIAIASAACVPSPTPSVAARAPSMYEMPLDLSEARGPEDADPKRAAELAEASLSLLDPARSGGPDYAGAAKMCLLAEEVATSEERRLGAVCLRVAARSALRAGDRELYVRAVDRWESVATRSERTAGEFAVHVAIRDRLQGLAPSASTSRNADLRRLLRSVEELDR